MPTRAQRIGQIGRVAMVVAVATGGLWVIHRERAMQAQVDDTWSVDVDGDDVNDTLVLYARAPHEDGRLVEAMDGRTGKRVWRQVMPPGDPGGIVRREGDDLVVDWVMGDHQAPVRLDVRSGAVR